MSLPIPETMQAVRLEEENGKLQERQIPVPRPGPGEVLVRMAASTVNPSDIGFMYSTSGNSDRKFPVTPGNEGSGTVVAAGQGYESFALCAVEEKHHAGTRLHFGSQPDDRPDFLRDHQTA